MSQIQRIQGISIPFKSSAVNIKIDNPQVITSAPAQNYTRVPSYTAPIYNYPQAQVYEMPQQSIYQASSAAPQTVLSAPAAAQMQPVTKVSAVATKTPAPAEAKAPQASNPDINAFISKLMSPDYEEQANTMEAIANLAQSSSPQATAFLDVKVIDTLLGIMDKDTSKLQGPTPEQLQIREKMVNGKPVTDAEKAQANKITPMELAERNKQYSMYTVAILQKLYSSEIEKMDGSIIPITELPGAAAIVKQVKSNPNPMGRAAAINALSYIQRPEYKDDLTTLFTVAKKDKDTQVQQAATKALDRLSQVGSPPTNTPPIEKKN